MSKAFVLILFICLVSFSILASTSPISRDERMENTRHKPLSSEVLVLPLPLERPMSVAVPYFNDFESGTDGWARSATTSLCSWQYMTDPEMVVVDPSIYGSMVVLGDPAPAYLPMAKSGRNCWWYGNPENGTFIGHPFAPGDPYSGGTSISAHSGTLTSPLFETAALPSITFSFWTWWEVECIDINSFDMMYIKASSDGGGSWNTINWLNPPFSRLPGWDEYEGYSSGGWLEPGIWIKWTYFLDPEWWGHDIMIRFEFDTRDMLYNGFRGWLIDDFYISGGIEEPHLFRSGDHPEYLDVVDCALEPNPFYFEFTVTNSGGEAASDVVLLVDLPSSMSIVTGFDLVTLGTILPEETIISQWQLSIDEPPLYDSSICWEVLLTSADSLIGFIDDFEGDDRLFVGSGGLDYCDVRRPGGPSAAISGLGVSGIPSSGTELNYGASELAYLTSQSFTIDGWTEAYIAFWYWLDVHYEPLWSDDGEDGFLVEYQIDGGSWIQLDQFGVGILLPRYDAYIDEWSMTAISNKMAYCKPTDGRWIEVVSQDLIDMGILSSGDNVRFRFVFASDATNHGQGLFIDDFRLSTHQYPVGPFLHTFCVEVPGLHTPFAELVMPLNGRSSSCPDQPLVINTGGEALIDADGVVIWADGTTRFAVEEGNMSVDTDDGVVIAQPLPSQLWTEGWHSLTLDTCFNILGCNLVYPLYWSFLSDQTPPEVILVNPSDGVFFNQISAAVTVSIADALLDINPATVKVLFCGSAYDVSHPAVLWDGFDLIFDPELTGSGMTWLDCGQFCVVAGDMPDYCEPNIDTTCFPITIDFSVPWAELITPQFGEVSACSHQEIVIALFDSNEVSPNGVEIVVNAIRYISGVDPELFIDNGELVFTPSSPWEHGGIVSFALEVFYNTHGTANVDTLRSSFVVDLFPPALTPISPLPDQLITGTDIRIEAAMFDFPAGLEAASIDLLFMGRHFDLSELSWTGNDSFASISLSPANFGLIPTWGDTFEIEIYICDSPDLCEPNCTTYIWDFHMEPQTGCAAFPNPFSPNGDEINDVLLFDYPHRYIQKAHLKIFSINNILIYDKEIEQFDRLWDGHDNHGNPAKPGLYIYLIEGGGRILCNGTIVLVR